MIIEIALGIVLAVIILCLLPVALACIPYILIAAALIACIVFIKYTWPWMLFCGILFLGAYIVDWAKNLGDDN